MPLRHVYFVILQLWCWQVMGSQFSLVRVENNGQTQLQLTVPGIPDSYFILVSGDSIQEINEPIALLLGRDASIEWGPFFASPVIETRFFSLQQYSTSSPADWDGDGIDDLFEFRSDVLDPFDPQDALSDSDEDGSSNLLEYQQGTGVDYPATHLLEAISGVELFGEIGERRVIHGRLLDLLGRSISSIDTNNLTLSLVEPAGSQRVIPLPVDGQGEFRWEIDLVPGASKAIIVGPGSLRPLEFYLTTERLVTGRQTSLHAFAGQEVLLPLWIEGRGRLQWRETGSVRLQISRDGMDWERSYPIDENGKVALTWVAEPGDAPIIVRCPELSGQIAEIQVQVHTSNAEKLDVRLLGNTVQPWIPLSQASEVLVTAQDGGGRAVPGAKVDVEIESGFGEIVLDSPYTDLEGQLTFSLVPTEVGILSLRLQNSETVVDSHFAVEPVTYQADLKHIIQKCTLCHHPEHSLPLVTFDQVRYGIGPRSGKPIVNVDDVDGSPLVFMTDPNMGEMFFNTQCCSPEGPLTAGESELIRNWVRSGALESFLRPGRPVLIAANHERDLIAVPGTQFPETLRFVVLDSVGVPVPLIPVTVQSSEPEDQIGLHNTWTGYDGEVAADLVLANLAVDRSLSVQAPKEGLELDVPLKVNPSYDGGSLEKSDHPLDRSLLSILKPRNVEPTRRSERSEFLLRVVEDTLGRHPHPDDPDVGDIIREYLRGPDSPASRADLIDGLVGNRAFLQHWIPDRLSTWIEVPAKADPRDGEPRFDEPAIDFFAADDSIERFVKALGPLGGRGSSWDKVDVFEPGYALSSTHDVMEGGKNSFEQVMGALAGVSIRCARCHDHKLTEPGDDPRWTQAQAYDMYAYFAENKRALALPRNDGGTIESEVVTPTWWVDGVEAMEESSNPVTTFFDDPVTLLVERRLEFWERLTDSPRFSLAVGHRIWSELAGPLLDPVDIREGTLRPLRQTGMIRFLETLQNQFDEHEMGLRRFVAFCLKSQVYQLSSGTTRGYRIADDSLLARFPVRRRFAEVLNHGASVSAGNSFNGHSSVVLKILGYPSRRLVPHWDHRRNVGGITEALMLLNSSAGAGWRAARPGSIVHDQFRVELSQAASHELRGKFVEMAEELVFRALLREPSEAERALIAGLPPTFSSLEELAGALGACSEFVFR